MKLIFLYGSAASGKLTVGRALQSLTGFGLFHNHLVVDALLAIFSFGSPAFVRLREQMWLSVFQAAAAEGRCLIFTFAPEPTVDSGFVDRTVATVEAEGGVVHFVELICPMEELERRVGNASRAEFMKLRSVSVLRSIQRTGGDVSLQPRFSELRIDTNSVQPIDAARTICTFFDLPVMQGQPKSEPYSALE